MSKKFSRFLFLLLPFTLLTAACSDDLTDVSQGGVQTRVAPLKGFTLLLTDAPGDVKAAVVASSIR